MLHASPSVHEQRPQDNLREVLDWPFPDRRPHWLLRLLAANLWLPTAIAWWFLYLAVVYVTNSLDLSTIPAPRTLQGLVALLMLRLIAAGPYARMRPWFDWLRHDRLLHQQAEAALRDINRLHSSQAHPEESGHHRHLHKASVRLRQALADRRPRLVLVSLSEIDRLVVAPRPLGSRGGLREYLISIAFAVLVAQCVTAFWYDGCRVVSGTMLPTLQVHDQILVHKASYGIRLLFTNQRLFSSRRQPQPGDVIVFSTPASRDCHCLVGSPPWPGKRYASAAGTKQPVAALRFANILRRNPISRFNPIRGHRVPPGAASLSLCRHHTFLRWMTIAPKRLTHVWSRTSASRAKLGSSSGRLAKIRAYAESECSFLFTAPLPLECRAAPMKLRVPAS